MTFDEVVKKWSKKHSAALKDVISYIEKGNTIIILPKKHFHHLVTTQIFADFGFSLTKVSRINGKKAFYRYEKIIKN